MKTMQGQKHNAKKKKTNEKCKKCKGKNTAPTYTWTMQKKTSAETQRKTMQTKNAENAGAHQKSGRQNCKQKKSGRHVTCKR